MDAPKQKSSNVKDELLKEGWQTNIPSSSMSIEKEVLCAAQRHQQHDILGCNGHWPGTSTQSFNEVVRPPLISFAYITTVRAPL